MGEQPYVRLEVKVHIWSNLLNDFDREGKRIELTDAERSSVERDFPRQPASDLARVRRELQAAAVFYFVNSGFHCHPALTFEVHGNITYRGEIDQDDYPHLTPKPELYATERDLTAPSHYDGLIHIERAYDYDRETRQFTRVRGGGGFTLGVDDEMKTAGLSWFAMTEADHPSSNHWLFTHEFHHQLDRMFELSGHPEYWFCHFSPTEGTDGPFGEHYDGNAWILREWPDDRWFELAFGALRYFKDADGDGVPDGDVELPFDEKRFGSLPTARDSDGDGMDDLSEVQLIQWASPGLGEQYPACFHWPAPLNPDADADGLPDGQDPLPLYPVSELIPEESTPESWTLSACSLPVSATLQLSCDEKAFHIEVLATDPVELKVMIDAGGDGWWTGKNNVWFVTDTEGTIKKQYVLNCTVPDKWPFEDETLLTEDGIAASHTLKDGYHHYSFKLARDSSIGLTLEPGQKLGLDIGYRLPGETFYTDFFEPNVLKWFYLGESPSGLPSS